MILPTRHLSHRPHPGEHDDPEPGGLPVEPDQGPVPPVPGDDTEHEGVVDPEV